MTAPRAAWRAVLVPATSHAIAVSEGGLSVAGEGEANGAGASRRGTYQWAELMRRTFGLDSVGLSLTARLTGR
jgi:hypothetical protein